MSTPSQDEIAERGADHPASDVAGSVPDHPAPDVAGYYRAAAADIAGGGRDRPDEDGIWGGSLYDEADVEGLPADLVASSLGCGNPFALAELHDGEIVVDLGSGAGLDVILSARRVAPTGKAYGVDFLEEMRSQARANAAEAGVDNVEFLDGTLDAVPLGDASVDVVISNCVLCLAEDKRPVFAEIARLLRDGGRVAVSDVVAADDAPVPDDPQAWAELGAGGLGQGQYVSALEAAGFEHISVEFTHQVAEGLHSASVRAVRVARSN